MLRETEAGAILVGTGSKITVLVGDRPKSELKLSLGIVAAKDRDALWLRQKFL